ncbi:MAG: 5'-3' exonuclease [Proteobacteria bacterium]|nr:5'-3' exonuclease [Pseudomonadota bacterium]
MTAQPEHARTLSLLDATSMLHRAWYGAFRGGEGPTDPAQAVEEGTGAFGAVLGRFLTTVQPRLAIAIFDGGGRTLRHERFEAYKAHRKPTPPGLAALAEHAPDIARALGLHVARTPCVEADDLIAVATERGRRAGLDVVVVSPDKDVAQLVDERVWRADPKSFELEDAAAVEAHFGVPPHRIRDWLALTGDASDGIPGVAGVGPKTAAGLLQAVGSIEALYADPEAAMAAKVRGAKSAVAKILDQREAVEMSWELVGLRTDVPAPDLEGLTVGKLKVRGPSPDAVSKGLDISMIMKLRELYPSVS